MPNSDCTTPLKRCTKCGNEYPATTEHFPAKSSGKYGVSARCWPCHREAHRRYSAEWRDRNPEAVQAYSRWDCETHAEERRERSRQYREKHPDKVKAANDRWRENNHDHVLEVNRARYARNKPEILVKRRAYRARNHERVLKENREGGQRWREKHPDRVRELRHQRRSAPGSFTTEDLARIRAAQTDKKGRLICWACGYPIIGKEPPPHMPNAARLPAHLDHWLPVKHQGDNSPGNLHYMHGVCNLSKGDKHPTELGRLL